VSRLSPDARAVVRALTGLTKQVRRLADARQEDFVLTPDVADDVPPSNVPADRQAAYAAVYAYIRQLDDVMPTSRIDRNAIIWHAVNAALDTHRPMNEAHALADGTEAGFRAALAAVDTQQADRPCDQHPSAPVIGGMCGACTQYPADMRAAPVGDNAPTTDTASRRCVCGDSLEWYIAPAGGAGWVHVDVPELPVLDAHKPRPADDEDAPYLIRVLADRAACGVLSLPGEGDALRRRTEQMIAGRETWKAKAEEIERDRNRLAEELEGAEQRAEAFRQQRDQARGERDRSDEAARLAREQRQEMAEERYAWQERGDRAEAAIERVRRLATDAARTTDAGIDDHAIGRHDMAAVFLAALDGTKQPSTKD
jgi:hypothetical protein